MIPEGWTPTELGTLADFTSGGTPSKQNDDFWGGTFPWVSAKDLKKHVIDSAELGLTDAGKGEANTAPVGAVLILVRGMTLLKDVPIGYVAKPVAFNQDIKALIAKGHVDPKFLAYLLVSLKRPLMSLVNTANHGTGRLDTSLLKAFPVILPPIEEQRRIAKRLDAWDRAIETVEALIANARAQKQALMQQLLPQGTTPPKKRLPGFSGEWRTLRIGDVAKEISERAGEEAGYPVLSCSKYDGMVESLTYFKKKVYSDDTSNYKVMRRGTFGFPSNHIEEGSIGYQDLFDAGIVSPIYCVFATDEQVEDGFLYKLLKTDRYRQIFAAATNASVDRRGSLRWKEFSRIPLPLPPLEEQRAINEAVNAVADVERGYESQLTALRQEKAALMQQLLTGKRRVKLPESPASESEVV